jgi:hypothetical protein
MIVLGPLRNTGGAFSLRSSTTTAQRRAEDLAEEYGFTHGVGVAETFPESGERDRLRSWFAGEKRSFVSRIGGRRGGRFGGTPGRRGFFREGGCVRRLRCTGRRFGAEGLPDLPERFCERVIHGVSPAGAFAFGKRARFLLPAFLPENLEHQIGDEQKKPECVF